MGRRLLMSIPVLVMALAIGAGAAFGESGNAGSGATAGKANCALGQGQQAACATQQARRRNGRVRRRNRNLVACKLGRKRRVVCPKRQIRGQRGRRGLRGPPGPAGPEGPTGPQGEGAGSGLTLNFNAKLNANDNKQITIGNFTVRAASNEAGNCANIQLIAGDENSRVATGSGGAFTSVGSNNNIDLQAGNTTDMFTAISENGGSTVSGIVGRVNVGGFCLVSGYVTGV